MSRKRREAEKPQRAAQTVFLTPASAKLPQAAPDGDATRHPGVPIDAGRNARLRRFRADKILADGENRYSNFGFCAQTVNGTAYAGDHPGWNQQLKTALEQAQKVGPWKRGNRSAE